MNANIDNGASRLERITRSCRKTVQRLLLAQLISIPVAWTPAAYADEAPDFSGLELYRHFCASCHGARGRGNGPVAKTLKASVPDLTVISKRNGGIFPTDQIHRFIDGQTFLAAHGSREMPVWGWEFYGRVDEEPGQRKHVEKLIGRLVDYLHSIQR